VEASSVQTLLLLFDAKLTLSSFNLRNFQIYSPPRETSFGIISSCLPQLFLLSFYILNLHLL
jgi:hypothetical protein